MVVMEMPRAVWGDGTLSAYSGFRDSRLTRPTLTRESQPPSPADLTRRPFFESSAESGDRFPDKRRSPRHQTQAASNRNAFSRNCRLGRAIPAEYAATAGAACSFFVEWWTTGSSPLRDSPMSAANVPPAGARLPLPSGLPATRRRLWRSKKIHRPAFPSGS